MPASVTVRAFLYARQDERTTMEGENNGTQAQQGTQQQENQQQQAAQQPQQAQQQGEGAAGAGKPGGDPAGSAGSGAGVDSAAYEAQLAERDKRIEELEAQVADAAKTAEAAEALKGQIAELKAQGADERVEFSLKLAGVRNVKAAKAVLADHGGDIEALKAAEPWMFADAPQQQTGKTGLPNAGAATDADKQMKEWREIAGLSDDK